MKGALIILAVTVLTGIILYILDRRNQSKAPANEGDPDETPHSHTLLSNAKAGEETAPDESAETTGNGECCGLHLVCEKELEAIANDQVLYYDDEELDRFANRNPEDYNAEETEEFRDILLTLLPQDVPGWARSLDRRNIRPPQEIRDELLIMLQEMV
ncbi:MAG: phospholipase [Muribaculaceae bacterium]|nr:phospholipase [Muribaculaceae bacterium]